LKDKENRAFCPTIWETLYHNLVEYRCDVLDNVIKTKPLTKLVDPTTKTIKKLETKLVDKKISKISKP
jgi:hypothetical protein